MGSTLVPIVSSALLQIEEALEDAALEEATLDEAALEKDWLEAEVAAEVASLLAALAEETLEEELPPQEAKRSIADATITKRLRFMCVTTLDIT